MTALGAEDGGGFLVFGELIVVALDELALLELERVARDVGHVVLLVEPADQLRVLRRAGAAH